MYEYDLISLTLLFFTGVLAGVINVMAGGGSSIVLPVLIFLGIDLTFPTVSYTHLRAHETVLDLVCRLLLEKKKL